MICFINRSTVDYDVRLQKYVQACIETNTPYCVIAWDRLKNCSKVYPNEHQYKVYAPYGAGWNNLIALIGWVFYLWFMLIKLRKQYTVIHACNLENCRLSYFMRWFGKKMVLDIYDTQNKNREKKLAKLVEGVILPSDQRQEQVGFTKDETKNYLEVENVPIIKYNHLEKVIVEFPNVIHLAYVGVFQSEIRGLENLLKMVDEDDRFILDIAGTGGGLDELVKTIAAKNPRVVYHGKVDYQTALSLMAKSDFIIALYYLSCKEHKYASPNKYYESLALGKPVVTSKNTLIGNNVLQHNTGYVIDDTLEALKSLFNDVNTENFKIQYEEKSANCISRWKNFYSSYFEDVLKKKYIEFIYKLKDNRRDDLK